MWFKYLLIGAFVLSGLRSIAMIDVPRQTTGKIYAMLALMECALWITGIVHYL